MHIYGPAHVHGAQPINPPHRAQSSPPATASQNAGAADQLDISQEADMVSRALDTPGIRHQRVAEIRAAIESGEYETEEKLEIAVSRLLDEIA